EDLVAVDFAPLLMDLVELRRERVVIGFKIVDQVEGIEAGQVTRHEVEVQSSVFTQTIPNAVAVRRDDLEGRPCSFQFADQRHCTETKAHHDDINHDLLPRVVIATGNYGLSWAFLQQFTEMKCKGC